MKSPLSSPGKISNSPKSRWAHHISQTVRGALMGVGLLSIDSASAQALPDNMAERLERSQKNSQTFMSQNQELKKTIEQLWSQLKDIPGVPDVLYDDLHNITPEAQAWIRENLPKQYIALCDELSEAANKKNQSPLNSIGGKKQALIVGSILLLSILIIYNLKKKKKNCKELEMIYEKIMDSSGKTNHAEILTFLEKLLGEYERARGQEIGQAIMLTKLKGQLRDLPSSSLCMLTLTDPKYPVQYIYSRDRRESDQPANTQWTVLMKNKEYTMSLSGENEVILDPHTGADAITTPLQHVSSIYVIDTTTAPTIPRYPNRERETRGLDSTEWYMMKSGVSELITTGKKVMMITESGSVYILEVLPDNGGFEVLPESPQSSYPAGTILSHINAYGGLVLKDDKYTSRVKRIIPLDMQSGTVLGTENSPAEEDTALNLDGLSHAELLILREKIVDAVSSAQTADEYNHSSVEKIAAELACIDAKIKTLSSGK